ncbi:MAG: hypothetical protein U1F47_03130 [Hyphomicrobiales bacterium]
MWTEDCTFDNGRWNVAHDKMQDFFGLHVDNGELYPVLRHFRVDPAKGLRCPAARPEEARLVLDSPDCVFMKSEEQGAPGWTMWQVMPVGKVKAAFEALPKDEVPELPCGQTGYAVDSIGFFMTHADHPDRVLYVNLGQDGTMIDPFSVQLF